MFRTPTLLVLAIAAAIAPIAHAQPQRVSSVVEVDVSDLDLSTLRGGEALLGRIVRAASQACGGHQSYNTASPFHNFPACRRQSVAEAVRRLQIESLAFAYRKSIGASDLMLASR